MHHAAAEDISDVYAFEQERKFSHPLRIKDLYHRFVSEHLTDARPDWDNMSEEVHYLDESAAEYADWELSRAEKGPHSSLQSAAPSSFEDCRKLCESEENCLQFRYTRSTCSMSGKITHGKPVKKGEEDESDFNRAMSGWIVERVKGVGRSP